MLLVLDNADTAEQVRALTAGRPGSVVLVTTRRNLAGLGPDDGVQSLTVTHTYIGPTVDPQER